MELRTYLRLLLQGWWLILSALLVSISVALILTYSQTPIYRTTATFVVSPGATFSTLDDLLRGWDSLSRREGAMATYVEIAKSSVVLDAVYKQMGLPEERIKNFRVSSEMLPSTNIIKITVESDDPLTAKVGADLVGQKTMEYVRNLSEVYDIKALDPPFVPELPSKPQKAQNLFLAVVLGSLVGTGLTLFLHYLRSPIGNIVGINIIDGDTGVFNRQYFLQRLGEEMSRAKRNKYPLSLALMNIDHPGVLGSSLAPEYRSEALRKVTVFLKQYLREEDVMARLEGTTFAILLPDMQGEKAAAAMEKLQTRMAWTAFEIENSGVKLNLSSASGVVAYNYNGTGHSELVQRASYALQQAETGGYGKVYLFRDNEETGTRQDESTTKQ